MVVEGEPEKNQGDHGWKGTMVAIVSVGTGEMPVKGNDWLKGESK